MYTLLKKTGFWAILQYKKGGFWGFLGIRSMFCNIIVSVILGLFFGFCYGFIFVKKLKRLYSSKKEDFSLLQENKLFKQFKRKMIFNITTIAMLLNIFIIIGFLFLIFFLHVNILVVLITFMITFWSSVLFFTRSGYKNQIK